MSPRDTEVTDQVTDVCPVRDLLDRIGSKWTVQVIEALAGRTLRFTELERAVDGVSRRVLVRTLRALERDGLLRRTVHPTVPVTVEYALTPLAAGLGGPLTALADWARTHRADMVSARRAYDAAARPALSGDPA